MLCRPIWEREEKRTRTQANSRVVSLGRLDRRDDGLGIPGQWECERKKIRWTEIWENNNLGSAWS